VDLWLLKPYPEPPPGNLTSVSVCLLSDSEYLGPTTDETYFLRANTGVGGVIAPTVFGMLHALETFSQLIDNHVDATGWSVPTVAFVPVEVYDGPRYPFRGLLIDTARHFLPVSHIRNTIAAAAMVKLNVIHWHITDSSAFPCGSNVYPQFAEKGAYAPTVSLTRCLFPARPLC
jgi:hexosaminidase